MHVNKTGVTSGLTVFTLAFLINPHLANNKTYLVSIIIGSFWLLTFINLKGVQASARFAKVCAIFGMIIPMFLIIGLFIAWLIMGKPVQIHLNAQDIFPAL